MPAGREADRDAFPANLAHVCGYYPSISEVCRRLGINRQQFNRYLGGQARPSRYNMRRICDFFGVTESEILLEPAQFERLVSLRRQPLTGEEALAEPLRHVEALYRSSTSLSRYVGYYFRYYHSFGYPGRIISHSPSSPSGTASTSGRTWKSPSGAPTAVPSPAPSMPAWCCSWRTGYSSLSANR